MADNFTDDNKKQKKGWLQRLRGPEISESSDVAAETGSIEIPAEVVETEPGAVVDEPSELVVDTATDADGAIEAETLTEPAADLIVAEVETPETDVTETPVADVTEVEGSADGAPEAVVEVEVSVETAPEWPRAESPLTMLFVQPPALPEPRVRDEAETGETRRRGRRRGAGPDDRPEQNERFERSDRPERSERERPEPKLITEPARVKGSTRLEAKKQRRRDGRDAGRRRTVITESEFLARRESVDRTMVVRAKGGRTQIAVLEDDVLVEHYVAKSSEASLIGNVYLGRVQNVLPSMEAAFVDIGRGRNAVLYSGEVDWQAAQAQADSEGKGQQARRIELALKPGDPVLVQVTKDPVGHKGARLTSQISLPGRYLVYVPNGSMNGISRKLPETERSRLKKILKEVLPERAGVIVRTAAEGATEEQLTLDVQRLMAQWESISTRVASAKAPSSLHAEPDLLVKIIRDVFNEDFQRLVIEGSDALGTITDYLQSVAPDLVERIVPFDGEDSFADYRVGEQIEKALDRKVWLPSGGSLVIDRTEAMTVIDVNTGKFVGSGGNLEETVTKNNLEAAEEVVRQLRLRDIGGIIVVDFIDMVLESNRDLVQRRLVECLSRDRTKHQVAEVTSLGLVQMTRKKIGLGLLETFSTSCETCAGRGYLVQHEPGTKHRGGGGGDNGGRRGRNRGAAEKPAPAKQANGSNGTHAITDDARNALARVAASTVVHAVPENGDETDAAPETAAAVDTEPTAEAPGGAAAAAAENTESSDQSEVPAAAAPRRERGGRRRGGKRADSVDPLLESVLDALPEPKAPGHGRGSRRRASTSGVVTPTAQ